MLKNKNKPTVNGSTQKPPSLNMISEGTKIKGTITSKDDIRISGELDGEAICKGKLIVASSAHLDGDINSADADIAGHISGTIKVTNKLVLRQTAVVGGDIYTKILIVEEGAQLNGNCRMGSEKQELDASEDAKFAKATKKNADKESV